MLYVVSMDEMVACEIIGLSFVISLGNCQDLATDFAERTADLIILSPFRLSAQQTWRKSALLTLLPRLVCISSSHRSTINDMASDKHGYHGLKMMYRLCCLMLNGLNSSPREDANSDFHKQCKPRP